MAASVCKAGARPGAGRSAPPHPHALTAAMHDGTHVAVDCPPSRLRLLPLPLLLQLRMRLLRSAAATQLRASNCTGRLLLLDFRVATLLLLPWHEVAEHRWAPARQHGGLRLRVQQGRRILSQRRPRLLLLRTVGCDRRNGLAANAGCKAVLCCCSRCCACDVSQRRLVQRRVSAQAGGHPPAGCGRQIWLLLLMMRAQVRPRGACAGSRLQLVPLARATRLLVGRPRVCAKLWWRRNDALSRWAPVAGAGLTRFGCCLLLRMPLLPAHACRHGGGGGGAQRHVAHRWRIGPAALCHAAHTLVAGLLGCSQAGTKCGGQAGAKGGG